MNVEYFMFHSRQHYFDKTDTSWSDLKMGSLDAIWKFYQVKKIGTHMNFHFKDC